MKMIVNADDLGLTTSSNEGIDLAFKKLYCTQATIIVNTNHSDEGARLAFDGGYADKVGLHINICEGIPLTEPIKKYKKYVRNGKFSYTPFFMTEEGYGTSPLNYYESVIDTDAMQKEILALSIELRAQIEKYLSYGFTMMHIDSHRNTIVDLPVWLALKPLLLEYKFKSMRPLFNSFEKDTLSNKIYREWYTSQYKALKLICADTSMSIQRYQKVKNNLADDFIEIYIHPIIINQVLIDNFTNGNHLDKSILQLRELSKQTTATHY